MLAGALRRTVRLLLIHGDNFMVPTRDQRVMRDHPSSLIVADTVLFPHPKCLFFRQICGLCRNAAGSGSWRLSRSRAGPPIVLGPPSAVALSGTCRVSAYHRGCGETGTVHLLI